MEINTFFKNYFVLFFIAVWIGVSFIVSYISGWASLAKIYRFSNSFDGKRWRFRSGQMRGMTNYGNILTIGANRYGLYLSVFYILRAGHPPIFIPWDDITITTKKVLLFKLMEFRFNKAASLFLRINEKLGQEVIIQREGS